MDRLAPSPISRTPFWRHRLALSVLAPGFARKALDVPIRDTGFAEFLIEQGLAPYWHHVITGLMRRANAPVVFLRHLRVKE